MALVSLVVHRLPDRRRDRRAADRQRCSACPGPYVQNPNLTDAFGSPLGPSLAHPFGVDQLGQDVMSRVIYGTRVALEVGILGTAVATVIGVVVGVLAGFYRGWVDTLLSRLIDVVLSIPILLLGLGIGAACAVQGLRRRRRSSRAWA